MIKEIMLSFSIGILTGTLFFGIGYSLSFLPKRIIEDIILAVGMMPLLFMLGFAIRQVYKSLKEVNNNKSCPL